jgi:Spy/CpxP family protein refolding chaperone
MVVTKVGHGPGDPKVTSRTWTAVIVAAALAAGAAATGFAGEDGPRPRAGRAAGVRGARRDRFRRAMRQERRDLLTSLGVTDEQRRTVLEKARAAAPIVAADRDEARRIVAQAWTAAAKDSAADRRALRDSVRGQLKALREKTRGQVEPLAKEVVASLTPEQRAKLDAAAARHGRTVDEARLVRRAARMISRPMTVPYLEARLAK